MEGNLFLIHHSILRKTKFLNLEMQEVRLGSSLTLFLLFLSHNGKASLGQIVFVNRRKIQPKTTLT